MIVNDVVTGMSHRLMHVTSRSGKTIAKKRSKVTETVERTDPTLIDLKYILSNIICLITPCNASSGQINHTKLILETNNLSEFQKN